jgi:hypothetical protein
MVIACLENLDLLEKRNHNFIPNLVVVPKGAQLQDLVPIFVPTIFYMCDSIIQLGLGHKTSSMY